MKGGIAVMMAGQVEEEVSQIPSLYFKSYYPRFCLAYSSFTNEKTRILSLSSLSFTAS